MNAHAVVMRYARAPLAVRSPYLPSSRLSQRRTLALSTSRYRSCLRGFIPLARGNSPRSNWLGALVNCAPSFTPAFVAASKAGKITAELLRSINGQMAGRLAAAAVTGAIAALAIINNDREQPAAIGISSGNETVIFRHAAAQSVPIEDEGEPVIGEREGEAPLSYPRPVQTIKFVSSVSSVAGRSDEASGMTKVGAFVAFAGRPAASETESDAAGWPAVRRRAGVPNMDEVDKYLWEVYQRTPTKHDHSGDFTWKDPAAAKRMGLSLPEYAISGMDPDFREQLYHAGQAMDAAGIQWSMLSAFRDDYRQRLASGFKARVGRSLHGGSGATGGWGHGRAVDLTSAEGDASVVWKWIDANGAKFGLYRPIPGPDPAHTQSRGDWHKAAVALRETRLRVAGNNAPPETESPAAKKVAKAGW
jgi:hypothetical protein